MRLKFKYNSSEFLLVLYAQETAAANGVTAMPTFLFFRNKTKIDLLRGADAGSLEEKIRKWYGSGDELEDETVVKGQVSITASYRCLQPGCRNAFPHCGTWYLTA